MHTYWFVCSLIITSLALLVLTIETLVCTGASMTAYALV